MKITHLLCALLFTVAPVTLPAADHKPAAKADATKRHPLRGVVTGILKERSSLLVKHEEIPGVMRAMTMAFQVDAATLAAVKEGDAITGLMSRQGTTWVLENVQVVTAKKK